MRAGAYGLSLLSDPLDIEVLRALRLGPLSLIDLRRAVGSPPQTTLRKHLKALTNLDLLIRTRQPEFPAPVTFELSSAGEELLATADSVESWLTRSPEGPLALGAPAAKSAIKSFVDGWTTKMVRALAAKPLSLTELDRLLAGVNYPALERRLAAMRLTGQVAPAAGRAGSTPYKVTRWLREAVGPLVAAADWECRRAPDEREPLGRLDVEAIFLLAVPLLDLPASVEGSCRLAVEISNGKQPARAGATVVVEGGRPTFCVSDLSVEVTSSATGSGAAWLSALSGGEETGIELTGDRDLGEAVVAGLRRTLRKQEDLSVA